MPDDPINATVWSVRPKTLLTEARSFEEAQDGKDTWIKTGQEYTYDSDLMLDKHYLYPGNNPASELAIVTDYNYETIYGNLIESIISAPNNESLGERRVTYSYTTGNDDGRFVAGVTNDGDSSDLTQEFEYDSSSWYIANRVSAKRKSDKLFLQ